MAALKRFLVPVLLGDVKEDSVYELELRPDDKKVQA